MNGYVTAIRQLPVRRIEELVIYFVLGTIAGRYLEIIWQYFRYHITDPLFSAHQLLVPPLAEPYGIGAVVVILLVAPFVKKYTLGVGKIYALNVFVTGLTEYICAVVLVLVFGHNNFWDYTGQPFNIQGYVCLETSLLFGILATLFLRFAYPAGERHLGQFSDRQIEIITLTLIALYIVLSLLFKRW